MTRARFALILLFAVLLTVPWFYTQPASTIVLGFPAWGAYAVGAAVVYAVGVAWALGRYWDLMAGEEDDAHG